MLTIQEFLQIYLDRAAPWIGVWMGAVALDMLFGGPKALGLIPSLDSLPKWAVGFLQAKLDRKSRSRRTLIWRGSLSVAVVVLLFGAIGYGFDQLVFTQAAFTALAVFFVAKFLSLKLVWQQLQDGDASANPSEFRVLARKPIEVFAYYYTPAAILFIIGGFSFLLPFSCLHAGSFAAAKSPSGSFFLQPFDRARSFVAWPGEIASAVILAFALLFWPAANWTRGFSAFAYLGKRIRNWPLTVVAYALNWSLEINPNAKAPNPSVRLKWIGPEGGSAKLKPTDLKSGLIVALIAFGLTNALLALLWLAAVIG